MWPFTRKNAGQRCGGCRGTGNCSRCGGEGTHDEPSEVDSAADVIGATCRRCKGSGVCVGCGGTGWVGLGNDGTGERR